MAGTAEAEQIERFGRLADQWWDPAGPMRPLHAMNPLRTGWVARQAQAAGIAMTGARLLDVGCGAGLASEAFARMGAAVTAIDAAPEAIGVARAHAADAGLVIDYTVAAPEDLSSLPFDIVTALEVIEHATDPQAFVTALTPLVRPGGLLVLSTLNRTARSFAVAKLGAEYLLRLLPVGTHDWRRFIPPASLGAMLRRAGCRPTATAGMTPSLGGWRESRDLGVNYLIAAVRG